jgi:hypothetical protein
MGVKVLVALPMALGRIPSSVLSSVRMARSVTIDYGTDRVVIPVEGETAWGDSRVLLHEDDNLIADCAWMPAGHATFPFLDSGSFRVLNDGLRDIVADCMREAGIVPPAGFRLEAYHRAVATQEAHLAVARRIQGAFPIDRFPIDPRLVTTRVSQVLGVDVSLVHPRGAFPEHFCIRVVRPGSRDNNPPHRDVWLDRLRDAVNIYAPIAGSDERSSLSLVEGSHLWKESEIERTTAGAKVGSMSYTVPSVVGASHPLRMVRPNPRPNHVLVFSPYLVHGGASNLNTDVTRVSLEMRFWRATRETL